MSNNVCLNTQPFTQHTQLVQWLNNQARQFGCTWFLAHALDGVIWGRFTDGLITSHDVDTTLPALNLDTLIQCRIFGEQAEVMLWQDDAEQWFQTVITDPSDPEMMFVEDQMLWGDQGKDLGRGFTLLSDGSQGLKHAVPCRFD